MPKTLLLLHGRDYKPPKEKLSKLWIGALRYGIEKDHPEKLQAFEQARIELVYYGDISNDFLSEKNQEAIPDDIEDREATLQRLKDFQRDQFTKTNYKKLPGYNPWKEGFADLFSGPLSFLRLGDSLIEKMVPDIGEYWRCYRFGSDVRMVFTDALINAMKEPGDLCVISHSLGTMIAYDVLWKLSHYGEYHREDWNRAVSLWMTMGSPLAGETVKRNLKGAWLSGKERYPTNVIDWFNVAAEDDYIAHDQRVANDFREMRRLGSVRSITDERIYNLAVRYDPAKEEYRSNPHHGTGYLIHPTVVARIADWLS